jgi:hypothetical protein
VLSRARARVSARFWTHVDFHGGEPGAGAFDVTIEGVDVVQDEQGETLLRNISVNVWGA